MKVTRKQFQNALKIINKYEIQTNKQIRNLTIDKAIITKAKLTLPPLSKLNINTKLIDIKNSVRLLNILDINSEKLNLPRPFNELKIQSLNEMSKLKFFQCRNSGLKTLSELEEICVYAGISLKD